MKLMFTRMVVIFIALLSFHPVAYSQANYEFKSPTLISGTALSIGAVYRFTTVKTGIDATVTISNITGGISITDIDGGGGFTRALQPVLFAPALSNGYVELTIRFYLAGTATPSVQTEVPITPIDVDGQTYSGLKLYEYDEIDMPNGYTYFQWAGSELTMTLNGAWARGKNNSAVDYPGIDTAQKTVMFTTVNANINTIKVRVGTDNQSNSGISRLRSLYFKRFSYPFEVVLPNRTLLSFGGSEKNGQIELKGILSASHTYDKIIVEKSSNGTSFLQMGEIPVTNGGSSEFPFTFWDTHPAEGANFYRVRLINSPQHLQEISNTLMIKTNNTDKKSFQIYNTMVRQLDPTVTLQSSEDSELMLDIADMSGRMVYSRRTSISKGVNVVDMPNFNAGRGYFVLTARTTREVINQKIIIQ